MGNCDFPPTFFLIGSGAFVPGCRNIQLHAQGVAIYTLLGGIYNDDGGKDFSFVSFVKRVVELKGA
jgi:hypothetical protein